MSRVSAFGGGAEGLRIARSMHRGDVLKGRPYLGLLWRLFQAQNSRTRGLDKY